jgi:hypothetical protein
MINNHERIKEFCKTEMQKELFFMFGGEKMNKKNEEVFSRLCALSCDDLMYYMKIAVDRLKEQGLW